MVLLLGVYSEEMSTHVTYVQGGPRARCRDRWETGAIALPVSKRLVNKFC